MLARRACLQIVQTETVTAIFLPLLHFLQFLKVDSPYDLSHLTSPAISIPQSPTGTLRSAGGTRARAGSLAVTTSIEPSGEVRDLWSRRRKIDGSLNRVPPQFFQCTYTILERLQGLRIGENTLTTTLTKEVILSHCCHRVGLAKVEISYLNVTLI